MAAIFADVPAYSLVPAARHVSNVVGAYTNLNTQKEGAKTAFSSLLKDFFNNQKKTLKQVVPRVQTANEDISE